MNFLQVLPTDILLYICKNFLNHESIRNISETCKDGNALISLFLTRTFPNNITPDIIHCTKCLVAYSNPLQSITRCYHKIRKRHCQQCKSLIFMNDIWYRFKCCNTFKCQQCLTDISTKYRCFHQDCRCGWCENNKVMNYTEYYTIGNCKYHSFKCAMKARNFWYTHYKDEEFKSFFENTRRYQEMWYPYFRKLIYRDGTYTWLDVSDVILRNPRLTSQHGVIKHVLK